MKTCTFSQFLDQVNLAQPVASWGSLLTNSEFMKLSFDDHLQVYQELFSSWNENESGPAPVVLPGEKILTESHLATWMKEKKYETYEEFHQWTITNREAFWSEVIDELGIVFDKKPEQILEMSSGPIQPQWLKGARYNIVKSCFLADPQEIAVIGQKEGGEIYRKTYQELNQDSDQVAHSLVHLGVKSGDTVAIDMVMGYESVAIYLGILKVGAAIVGIADSFAADEIETRLKISQAKYVFTQDFVLRGSKKLPLYDKVIQANAPQTIVLACEGVLGKELREGDISWNDFLIDNKTEFDPVSRTPDDVMNVLFSSGTTGTPKAIPWTQTTPIKAAMDGYFHHDIFAGEVIAWPTSLGWMMGPWLIFAALMNKATIALYEGAPVGDEFCRFVQDTKVNMLGVVPSLVKTWKNQELLGHYDWSQIKVFSSTGECSNAKDMHQLMYSAGYKPVIEYCGGTEIGGGYITSTVVQNNSPAIFSTPALGLDFVILDEDQKISDKGEVFLSPPSMGLSQKLLNKDHDEVYYEGAPQVKGHQVLRRHGDYIEKLSQGYFRAHGRADDTMNLGGIKVSSADIERVLNQNVQVKETAAIAVTPYGGGPSQLVVYTVMDTSQDSVQKTDLYKDFQNRIRTYLNPLFKIHEIELIESLPRTASNKVMRRKLRAAFEEKM